MTRFGIAYAEREHNGNRAVCEFGTFDIQSVGNPFTVGIDSFPACVCGAVDVDICACQIVGIVFVEQGFYVYAELIVTVFVESMRTRSVLISSSGHIVNHKDAVVIQIFVCTAGFTASGRCDGDGFVFFSQVFPSAGGRVDDAGREVVLIVGRAVGRTGRAGCACPVVRGAQNRGIAREFERTVGEKQIGFGHVARSAFVIIASSEERKRKTYYQNQCC